jgi:RNA polymerase sigma-70 factor (ECF subfamily)
MELVDRYSSPMRRFALGFVRTPAVADEVVQDAWLAVFRGIDRFEARSSLKTWIFRIVANTAITRAGREARSVPFSSLAPDGAEESSVDPDRFLGPDHPRWPGHWASRPEAWRDQPEERLLSAETRGVIDRTIAALPEAQRLVITLRDVEGSSSAEVSSLLDLSDGNQRVLLHRARSKVRAALEGYLQEAPA